MGQNRQVWKFPSEGEKKCSKMQKVVTIVLLFEKLLDKFLAKKWKNERKGLMVTPTTYNLFGDL